MRVTKVIVRVHINKIQEQEGRYSSISRAIAHNRHTYALRLSYEVARTCPLRHATRLLKVCTSGKEQDEEMYYIDSCPM